MAIVILRQDGKTDSWKEALSRRTPDVSIYNPRDNHPREEVRMAMVWKHPPNSLAAYPNLELVASFGAGVDFIFEDPDLPVGIPVTRVVDPVLASDMSEFVLARILSYLKHLRTYTIEQQNGEWQPRDYRRIASEVVGIMGVGALGSVVARDLIKMGFHVQGWVSSRNREANFRLFAGNEEIKDFLAFSTILVCLLPLTPATRGILNKSLFLQLPRGSFVINVARGGHLIDEDLLEALNSGHLSGAALDVFHEEPLPEGHPFWKHPLIHFTPHVASVSDKESVIPQLLENYRRLCDGRPLINLVSSEKGY
jgi:glyoxylate/hydroxypyruvate reductase A